MTNLILPAKPVDTEEDAPALHVNCLSCAAFRPQAAGSRVGACHFGPPQVVFMGFQNTPLGQSPILQNMRPGVGEREWCFHHVPMTGRLRANGAN